MLGRPTLAAPRVARSNLGLQLVPRDQPIHARQEPLPVRRLFLLAIFQSKVSSSPDYNDIY